MNFQDEFKNFINEMIIKFQDNINNLENLGNSINNYSPLDFIIREEHILHILNEEKQLLEPPTEETQPDK